MKVVKKLWFEVFSDEDISKGKLHGWIVKNQNSFKCSEKHHWTGKVVTLDDGSLGKKIDPSILDSKETIQSILKKESITLFRNVESVVQSLVSRYKRHFDSSQQSVEQHSFDEMIIAEITDEKLERATK